MPRLQYLNPNKAFKLFTNASKHGYSGILHQEEVSDQTNAVTNLVPVECYAVYRSIQKVLFYLAGTECTLYSIHKALALFFTTGTSSQVLDHWALELQQFNIQFEHILGKKNVVADAISRLRTLGLYQDNGNDDMPKMDDNIIEEVHTIEWVSNSDSYKMEKLNLDILREEQQQDTFCMKKVKTLNMKEDDSFVLDKKSILRKMVRVRYTIETTIVVLRKLTSLILNKIWNC